MIEKEYYFPIPLPNFIKVPLLVPPWSLKEIIFAFYNIFINKYSENKLISLSKRFFKSKYVIITSGASSALMLGLKSLNLSNGDEIIVQSMMCRNLIQAIIQTGCKPVFVDVKDDFNLDSSKIEKSITPETKAIIVSHMFGKLADIIELKKIADKYGIHLIDNAAVSPGVNLDGKMVGTFGSFGIVSFNIGKILNAGGGGLLLTDSNEMFDYILNYNLPSLPIYRTLKLFLYLIFYHRFKKQAAPFASLLRWLKREEAIPLNEIYDEFVPIIKMEKINRFSCSLSINEMQKLPEAIQICSRNAKILSSLLSEIKEIQIPQGDYPSNIFSYYPIIINTSSRFELGMYLRSKGIETKWSYYPIHLQKQYNNYRKGNMENTEKIWYRLLYLPVDSFISENQVRYIGSSIIKYFNYN